MVPLQSADGQGNYTIGLPSIDNGAAVWDGQNAEGNSWNVNNADEVPFFGSTTGSVTLTLLVNEANAVTIYFTNHDGAGQSVFNVQSPTKTYTGTNPLLFGDCGNNFIP